MDSSRDFTAIRLEEVLKELDDLRGKFRELSAKLGVAENTIAYYGNHKSYGVTRITEGADNKIVFQDRLTGDYSEADNDRNTKIAGARARLYFQTLPSKDTPDVV